MSPPSMGQPVPQRGLQNATTTFPHERVYKACSACQSRKVRCIIEDRSSGSECKQCRKDGIPCIFEVKNRAYDTSSRLKKSKRKRSNQADDTVFTPGGLTPKTDINSIQLSETNVKDAEFGVRSSADALLVLSNVAARHQDMVTSPPDGLDQATQIGGNYFRPPSLIDENFTETSASPWISELIYNEISKYRCRLFWENYVLPHEALTYLRFFFLKLYPFFPFIPDVYYLCITSPKPDLHIIKTLFEEDDILLGCIVTVSSRYYHLPKSAIGGFERSCEIHSRCWNWVRRQISNVIFEGSRPKAILSVVESLLMLAEWMPKSIHAIVDIPDQQGHGRDTQKSQPTRFISEQLLQPAFRTDHVSWSYVGNAFLLLRSLSVDKRYCPITKSADRYSITMFSCLIMSQSLARRLARQSLMSFDEVDMTQISQAFSKRNMRLADERGNLNEPRELSLGISNQFHQSFVDLMKLLAQAQEVLHPLATDEIDKSKAQAPKATSQLVTILRYFDNLKENWIAKYSELFEVAAPGMSNFSQQMLKADYEYLRLYQFSPSLGACLRDGGHTVANSRDLSSNSQNANHNQWEFPSSSPAYYLEQALDAAEILLRLLLGFHLPSPHTTLRYASSRHYMKIVFAAVFIMQVLRSGIPSRNYQNLLKSTLRETISTLGTCSVDSAHPAFRYSILLRCLMSDIEKRIPPLTPSPFSLTIGPRDRRQRDRNTVNYEPEELGLQPLQVNLTVNEGLPKVNIIGASSMAEARGTQTSCHSVHESGSPVLECFSWPEEGQFNISWENSLELLDGDMFLQPLVDGSLFD